MDLEPLACEAMMSDQDEHLFPLFLKIYPYKWNAAGERDKKIRTIMVKRYLNCGHHATNRYTY